MPLVAIQITGAWRPSSAVIGGALAADYVKLSVRYSVWDLLERSREWLNDGDGVFPQLLRSNLRDFTDPGNTFEPAFGLTHEDYDDRRTRFIEVLETAIGLSDPLVGLDPQLVQQLNKTASNPIRRFSSIPFGGDHKLKSVVSTTLLNAMNDVTAPNPQEIFNEDPKLTHIDLYSFLPAPHSPLVIRSLMEPIGQAWAPIAASGSSADVAISNFWFYRRTRPIMEFIPAPRPHIYAMVRGWYVGKLLGLIDSSQQNGPIKIVDPWDVNLHKYPFPYPTLSPSVNDNLASILESLALAYVQVGVDDAIDPLYPYVLLRKLGTNQGRSLTYWGELNEICATWLTEGKVPGSRAEFMLNPQTANAAMDVKGRREAALAIFIKMKEDYAKDYRIWKQEVDASPTRLGMTPVWPSMWEAIERSLTQLIGTLQNERAEMPGTNYR